MKKYITSAIRVSCIVIASGTYLLIQMDASLAGKRGKQNYCDSEKYDCLTWRGTTAHCQQQYDNCKKGPHANEMVH